MTTDRYSPYRALARQAGFDAIALVPGANFERLYEQSFHANERPLLVLIPVDGAPAALVPNLELGSFAALNFEGEVFDWRDQDGYAEAFGALLAHMPTQRLAVEGQLMRVFVHEALKRARPSLEIIDAHALIGRVRLCKSAEEIEKMREAIRRTEAALGEVLEALKTGMSEKVLESLLIQRLFAQGGTELAFAPIVAFAENSARPHAHAREHSALKPGDAVLFDFGLRHQGLCADITRTVFYGYATDAAHSVYQTVLKANRAGFNATRPGVSAASVDDAASSVLENSEWADRIRHKTGHGLGREVHEPPWIMRGNETVLEPGMVFTIEPGLYALDAFGVRIEDDILVTAESAESLSCFDRELIIIPERTP